MLLFIAPIPSISTKDLAPQLTILLLSYLFFFTLPYRSGYYICSVLRP